MVHVKQPYPFFIFFIGVLQGICLLTPVTTWAQVYTPVPVSGFNHDIVADTGTNALAVTTTELDLSNHILYTLGFAAKNNLNGGIVNNGAIINGMRTYQMQPYDTLNGLYLSLNGSGVNTWAGGTLTLATPAIYSKLSLLIFSTEGNSTVAIALKFTDGTYATIGNYTILDWFGGTNAVYQSFGRINRVAASPYTVDGIPGSNPQFYPLDIDVPCLYKSKTLQSVSINFISGTSAAARAVVLALSGVGYTPLTYTATVTPSNCGASNGSIALNVTGGLSPVSYLWSTSPAQNTDTAKGLSAGNYTCRIMEANGCATIYHGAVTQQSAATLSATASAAALCAGDSVLLAVTITGGTANNLTWMPGNKTGDSVTIWPAATTTYTVSAVDNTGCTVSASVPVTVKPRPVASFSVLPDTVCAPSLQTIVFTGKAGAGAAFNWNNFAGAAVQSGSGAGPYTILFSTPGIYHLQVKVTDNGCMSESRQDAVVAGQLEKPVVTVTNVTASSVTFSWTPVSGAIGYQVAINGAPYGNTINATSYTVNGLQPADTVTLQVIAIGPMQCQNSALAKATGKTISDQVFIPNSFTPNNDGVNDVFRVYGHIVNGMNMKVFNQWGELLNESHDITRGWDGRYKGKLQPVGVYVYVVRLYYTDGRQELRKGSVHLIH